MRGRCLPSPGRKHAIPGFAGVANFWRQGPIERSFATEIESLKLGGDVLQLTPAEFADRQKIDGARFGVIVRERKISGD